MDRYASQFADLLERQAARVRAMSVDRVRHGISVGMVGMVAATLVFTALTFLVIGIFRYVGEAIGVTAAYALFGGIFVLAGLLLWSKRDTPTED